jgi:hypothetical protein
MSRQEKSEELKGLEQKLNVRLETPYHEGDKVAKVKFHFSKRVWADLANKEGELLPMCCANISTIRDEFMDAMREDGWMDAQSMQNIVVNMSGHEWEADHPVSKVKQVYEELEPRLKCRDVMSCNPDNVRGAVSRVYFDDIWKFCANYGSDSMFSGWGRTAQERATHNKRLYDIMPTVRALYKFLEDTKFGPADGVALVRKANGELYEFYGRGLALFRNEEEAQECLKRWINSEQVGADDAEIRKVRVSLEKGVEYIETLENPWETQQDRQIDEGHYDNLWRQINDLRRENEENQKNDRVEAILLSTLKQLQALNRAGLPEDDE